MGTGGAETDTDDLFDWVCRAEPSGADESILNVEVNTAFLSAVMMGSGKKRSLAAGRTTGTPLAAVEDFMVSDPNLRKFKILDLKEQQPNELKTELVSHNKCLV